MPRTVLTVFLSSTGKDLDAYRAEVRRQASACEFFKCVAMEEFGPRDAQAVEFCTRHAREADLFVGLIGLRRGWEPDGDAAQRSITEMEYDAASERARPRFICLSPDDFPVPEHLAEPGDLTQRQLAFRRRVGAERVAGVHNFSEPAKLAAEIMNGLLSHVISSDLIQYLRPDLAGARPEEVQKPVAAAFEALAADEDVDLLALARNPERVDLPDLQAKLLVQAKAHEGIAMGLDAEAQDERLKSAEYYKHLGALAYLNDTKPALAAYAKVVQLTPQDPEGWNQLGNMLVRVGALDEAETAYTKTLRLSDNRRDTNAYACALSNIANVYQIRGEEERADAIYRRALQLHIDNGRLDATAALKSKLAELDIHRGQYDRAILLLNEASELYATIGHSDDVAAQHNLLGIIAAATGQPAEAEQHYLRAINQHAKSQRKDGLAAALGNYSQLLMKRGELQMAEQALLDALQLNEELARKEGVADICGNLSNVYFVGGDLNRAESTIQLAIQYNSELGRQQGLAANLGTLGNIQFTRGDYQKAHDTFLAALNISEMLGHDAKATDCLNNLGGCAYMMHNLDKSHAYFSSSLEKSRRLALPDKIAEAMGNLGLIELAQDHPKEAERTFQDALAIAQETGAHDVIISQHLNLSKLYLETGQAERVRQSLSDALALSESLGRLSRIADTRAAMGHLARMEGNISVALDNWRVARDHYLQLGSPIAAEIGSIMRDAGYET